MTTDEPVFLEDYHILSEPRVIRLDKTEISDELAALAEREWNHGDKLLAVNYFRDGAERGSIECQFFMGYINQVGRAGIERNYAEAIRFYQHARDKGHCGAANNLGILTEKGEGTQADPEKALSYFLQASDRCIEANYNIGSIVTRGNGVDPNKDEAEKWFKKTLLLSKALADDGNAFAQYITGRMRASLIGGLLVNIAKAESWFTKAAQQGHAESQYWLASPFFRTETKGEIAAQWRERAAAQGHKEAQLAMWDFCDSKRRTDDLRIFNWLEESAKHGHENAQFTLGCYYENGPVRDYGKAQYWHEKAVAQDFGWSYLGLGDLYRDGKGVEKNYREALRLYMLAGTDGAAFRIANIYRQGGYGIQKSEEKAKEWDAQAEAEDRETDDGFVFF